MKRPKKVEQRDDPKYCKYHHLVRHTIQDCFVFKDKVMQLARQGKISLEEDSAATNLVLTKCGFHAIPHVQSTRITYSKRKIPLMSMSELGISIDEFSNSRFMIQDTKASYNMLLRRLWLQENFVVPSTWLQCFKYCRNGIVRKVLGDSKPFTEVESHFADAKYYIEDAKKGKEVMYPKEPRSYNSQSIRKNDSSSIKVELSKGLTLPLTQINMKQLSKPPLKGFVPST
ncbi:hypothetical protein Sango_2099200 [Sesamum angolense]|uniref:Uncharacterized protein n=1 Tax=Sesamum angolense TaxID=2727404 RepID=A0AAE1WBV7_9LAMI|nr:hypothetical protein Sango_2099200 [Sesamum angolense]